MKASKKTSFPSPLLLLLLCLLPFLAAALPEDRNQAILIDASGSEASMEEGKVLYHGTADDPVTITQGSMRLTGLEVTVVMEGDNNRITSILATGAPARFQQQPAADKGIYHASADSLFYQVADQVVIAEGSARLEQNGIVTNAPRLEYDMEAGRAQASGGEGERVRMRIPPQNEDE